MILGNNLNNVLKERYDIDLMHGSLSHDDLVLIYHHYNDQRGLIKKQLGESCIGISAEYSKAYLISEAALMILREIAPKRKKPRKDKNK